MNELDKAICKMIADYLDKATEAIEHLSPDGAHEVAVVIADNELPHVGDLQILVTNLKKLEVISKMVNWRSNPSWERANGTYRRTMGSCRTFVT